VPENIMSSSRNLIGTVRICLDRLLRQRSALREQGFFDLPPQRGGLRILSGLARMPWTPTRQTRAPNRQYLCHEVRRETSGPGPAKS
jgi:hypothetical protein